MKQLALFITAVALCAGAEGSWYWPFSSDDEKPPRVSELMEPASLMIDDAYDLASEGKVAEAVEKFREALAELDRVEAANPDRVREPEFNTLKNKRATVKAAIDSLLLDQAMSNAKAIAVTDTSALQKKYDEKKSKKSAAKKSAAKSAQKKPEAPKDETPGDVAAVSGGEKSEKPASKSEPGTPLETAVAALRVKDYDTVIVAAASILEKNPKDAIALNLQAAAEIGKGDVVAAEKSLDQAIMSNPRSYFAYYNMARLMMRAKGKADAARRYYETGRVVGGPLDPVLEGLGK